MAEMNATATYLCIGCPLGCRLEVDEDPNTHDIVEVRGYGCRRGKDYAIQEHTAPARVVTTTVTITGAQWPRLPVRTSQTVPKHLVADICRELRSVQLQAPIRMNEPIIVDILDTGADVIATCDMPCAPGDDAKK